MLAELKREHRAAGERNMLNKSCDLLRSGCNRETRRGALPSTTSSWPARADAVQLPATTPPPRAEPRQTSSAARCEHLRACRVSRWSSAIPEDQVLQEKFSLRERPYARCPKARRARDRDRSATLRDDRDRLNARDADAVRCNPN